jgi:hypothetical protein
LGKVWDIIKHTHHYKYSNHHKMLQDHYTNVNFYCNTEVLVDKDFCLTEYQMNWFCSTEISALSF